MLSDLREWARGRGGFRSARNLSGAWNGSGLGQMTRVAGGILRAKGTVDGSDGTGGIGRTEGLGMGSGGGLTVGNGGTGSGGMGGVGSSGAQVGIGGQEAEADGRAGLADGSGLLGVMGRGTGGMESGSVGLARTWHGSGVGCKSRGRMTGAAGGIGWAEGIGSTMRTDDGGIKAGRGPGAWAASRTRYISCIAALRSSQVAGSSSISRTAAKVSQDASSV